MRTLRGAALAALLAGAAVAATPGCAAPTRTAEFREFAGGRYASARALYEQHIAEGGAEVTLDRCLAGTAALSAGDVPGAHRHFLEAFSDLEDLTATSGETAGAIVGPERSKRWKGDPFERCMNAYYTGVTYWLLGDPDNAAACFRAGLLRDADSEKGASQSDFAALWFLLGMAQREARHEDRGAKALETAHALVPENPFLDPKVAGDANVVLAVDVGFAPRKTPAGPHGAEVTFVPRRTATAFAEVSEAGRALGRTVEATDVTVQALTRGAKTMDDVNRVKAALKDAAVIGGAVLADNAGNRRNEVIGAGLIALGLLLPAEADVRQWDTLPGAVHVFAAKLAPGDHDLRVEPQDATGRPIPGAARAIRVTVRDGHVAFAWLRAGPSPAGVP